MAWDFFAHTRTLELLYHKMQAPVLEEYHLTQIELDVLLFLSHHPQQDTAKDIVEIRRLTKSHVSAAVEGLVQRQYLQRLRRPSPYRRRRGRASGFATTFPPAGSIPRSSPFPPGPASCARC